MFGYDASFAHIDPHAAAAAGFGFAGRYIGPGPAQLQRSELDDIMAAGLQLVALFELEATRATEGAGVGEHDAREARAWLDGLGVPPSVPIYFAVDFDAEPDAINDYFVGCANVLTPAGVGIYAGDYAADRMLERGHVTHFWRAAASSWGRGVTARRVDIVQHVGHDAASIPGVDDGAYDTDEALVDDFGGWAGATPAPEPAPAPDPGPAVGRVVMPQLAQGATGEPVAVLQTLVGADADGVFGPLTDAAVRTFQESAALDVDGIAGAHTWTALAQRATGAAVDGVYGPETTAHVAQYQTDHGLTVDGIAGPQTFGSFAGRS